jgi:uncharacterized glyoxalase superfamily protein PhnB
MAAKAKAKKQSKKSGSTKKSARPKAARAASKAAPKAAAKKVVAKKAAARKAAPARKASPPAPSYHTVTPFLNIEGAERAIAFYKDAFGAQERVRMPGPDGKIMHAELVIGDSVIMVSDAVRVPASRSHLHVYVDDCDVLYGRALAAGAVTDMPLQDMFWGDRYGSVTDPFGNVWSIATHKEDVAPEEMQKRMAAMPPPPPAAA